MYNKDVYLDYLKKYNLVDINAPLPIGSDEVQIHCPHGAETHKHGDRNKSASFNLAKNVWICYGCDKRGTLLDIVNIFEDEGAYINTKTLLNDDSIFIKEIQAKLNLIDSKPQETPDDLISEIISDLIYDHLYLRQRGKSQETYKHFQVGYDTVTDSIALPVYDITGKKIIGIQARNITKTPKYTFIVPCNKSVTFFGTQRIENWDYPIIVEGAFSVLNFFNHGHKNVLATLGSISDHQINYINKLSKMPTIIFDNDIAGGKMVDKFRQKCTIPYQIPTIKYGEVDELSNNEVLNVLNSRRII